MQEELKANLNVITKTIGGLLLVAFLVFFIFKLFDPLPEQEILSNQVQPTATFILSDGTYCYERIQQATESAPYSSKERVELTIVGNSVTGTKEGTQAGPDMTNGFWGDLVGTRDGTRVEVVYSYTVEGSEGKELELYELDQGTLTKLRYALYEEGDMLVPDRTEAPTRLIYNLCTTSTSSPV